MFFCASAWSFLFHFCVPFLAPMANFVNLKMKLRRMFGSFGLVYGISSWVITLLHLVVNEEDRVGLCTAFFMSLAVMSLLACVLIGIGGHKVSRFLGILSHLSVLSLRSLLVCTFLTRHFSPVLSAARLD
jgi:hypothetical protein